MSEEAIKHAVLKFMSGQPLSDSEAVFVAYAQASVAARWRQPR